MEISPLIEKFYYIWVMAFQSPLYLATCQPAVKMCQHIVTDNFVMKRF